MERKILNCAEKLLEWGFYGLAFLVPLTFTTATFELFEFTKMILVYLLTILIVSAFLVKSIISGNFKLKRTPLDFPILLYTTCYVLSTIFSIDRYTSIFGYYTRFNGGLLSLLCYVALYYVFVWEMGAKEKIEKFVRALLASSVLVSIYGILQHFGIDKDYWVQDVQRRVFSTLGQPNWLAAYLVMVMPVSLSLLLNIKNQTSKIQPANSYLLVPIALYTAFWFTYSRSGLLGFGAAMGTFLISLGRKDLKKYWRPLLLVGIAWAVISILTFVPKIVTAAAPSAEPQPPPTGSTVQIRLAVWKGALNLIKDHPLFGTGPETFAYSFLPYRPAELNKTAEWEFLYNKAHNEYLNIATCTGLLGLGAYLFLIGKFVLWSLKHRGQSILQAGIFVGWVGVLVSNFFGFSVVITSLLFWLFMALSVSYYDVISRRRGSERFVETNLNIVAGWKKLALVAVLLITSYCLLMTANLFLADVSFNTGERAKRYGLYETAARYYKEAIGRNWREPRYHRELASVLTRLGLSERAAREAEIAYTQNPRNSLTIRSLIVTYTELADLDPEYLTRAEELIIEAIDQQPTNPQLYYEQALVFFKAGKDEEARRALAKALELKPDYQKARELLETSR